jgi:hypothetical protein
MSEIVERVAARMWKAESEDAGVPASVTARRTYDAFLDQSDDTRAKWRKFARAAILAMREPTEAMLYAGQMANDEDGYVGGPSPEPIWTAMIAEALR